MSTLQLTNNAIGRLSSNAAAIDTSLVLEPGQGALFPALLAGQFFPVTLIRASDGAYEICKCTARAADVLTVERSQESTTAKAFLSGDRVEIRFTAGTFAAQSVAIEAAAATAQAAADAAAAAQDDIDALSEVGAIGTANLAGGAVTALKIADGSVTSSKLAATLDLSSSTLVSYKEKVFVVTGTAPALAPGNGTIQTWTLTANSIPTLGLWAEGQSLLLMINDGATYTINWSTVAPVWKTNRGVAPTLNTSGYTLISLVKVGATIFAARVGDA